MAETTAIEWTNHTFNPWIGCAKVHTGCTNCYAEQLMANRHRRVIWGLNGTRSKTKTWNDPKKWDRAAAAAGKKSRVFCASLADVFEDRDELIPWRQELFDLIDDCQNLDCQLLTKRPERIASMWPSLGAGGNGFYRDNVWLGTSIADQATADQLLPQLVKHRPYARLLFVSLEPQVGMVDLRPWLNKDGLNWVILSGESRQGTAAARPFDLAWASKMIGDCRETGTPVFLKQLGDNPVLNGQPVKFANKGRNPREWPADLQVREFPA